MAPVRRMRSRRTKRRNVRRRYTKRRVGGKPSHKISPDELTESLRPQSDMTARPPSPELIELAQRTMEVGKLEAKVGELDTANMGMAKVIKTQSVVIEQQNKLIEALRTKVSSQSVVIEQQNTLIDELKTKVSSLETELSSLKNQMVDDEFDDLFDDDGKEHVTDVTHDPIV